MTKEERAETPEKVEEKKEVAVYSEPAIAEYQAQKTSVDGMLMEAIKQKTDPAVVEKFLAMRKELKAEWAKEQFDFAMAKAQAEFPEIKKKTAGGKTKAGEVAYYYATLDDIVNQVKPVLAKYGLSYTIKTEVADGKVKSICIVKHIAGHNEESEMEIPSGTGTGIMSPGQVIAAASTFSKRYAFMNAFGILTGDEDKNGEGVGEASTGQVQAAIMLIDKCSTEKELLKVWSSFTKEIKANKEVIIRANEIKGFIKNENIQRN